MHSKVKKHEQNVQSVKKVHFHIGFRSSSNIVTYKYNLFLHTFSFLERFCVV